ncbi:methyltransferase domain-containing protein [Pseudonocardia sp. H11422]|uniref:methyltransferase domain-containing protein n=1 Tax=Pseudonocardia sp. H11422 TaxID=2835866 RepID=UPI001BDDB4ED|nr:methyltransferase domain-containing protein [Pseudonocardia sp. H11422]
MAHDQLVDPGLLREQVREKYREVATAPERGYHFHTGRPLARRLGYPAAVVDALPDRAVESFAGVANPFSLGALKSAERVVDIGSGAGFDAVMAAGQVGPTGRVVGVDMTPQMLTKARRTAAELGLDQLEFREGLAEKLPVEDGWADVVISNGVINLCSDKQAVFARSAGRCAREVGCSSPTSPTGVRSRWRRCATSTSGPVESPVGCPVRAGRRCSNRPGSPTSGSGRRSTRSEVRGASPTLVPSRSTASRSWPTATEALEQRLVDTGGCQPATTQPIPALTR